MEVKTNKNEQSLVVEVIGRLDTQTSPQLEEVLSSALEGVTELTLDFKELEYISSAGLRVVLSASKVMNKQGSMTVANLTPDVRDVFDVTGFSDMLNIA